jgi:hypothetical protein
MGKTVGTYTAVRDGAVYEYEATWEFFGYGVFWHAQVRQRGATVFDMSGRADLSGGSVDPNTVVQRTVERGIEARTASTENIGPAAKTGNR